MSAFDLAKAMGSVNRFAKNYESINKPEYKKEMKAYQQIRLKQVLNYSHNGWEQFLRNHVSYKKPFVVNGYEIMDYHQEDRDIEAERQMTSSSEEEIEEESESEEASGT